MKKLFLVGLAFGLSSCASVSPEAKKVRMVYEGAVVSNCKFIEQFEVSTIWSGTGDIQGNKELEKKAKNKAVELGGDTVLIQPKEQGWAGKSMLADAYKCNQ